ncbi:hypothetical protein FS837_010808 [Tulasnella sp. UAMH 9824]|nr:hypothetical protein FS837_010808 [Tulasnella sp. UAMH 9824]
MCWRPATGGFLTTLTATILLVVVSFNVPYFKTIYFLRATYNSSGQSGYITLGTLGYCLSVNGNESCTKPSIGYEFNPNTLLGNDTRLQIPSVVAKWLTYALFLHVIALALAGVSAIFGLLAHIREFSMSCFSSCISGAAAAICLIAFIFDLVLFFVAKARINSIDGASAMVGNAVWLTLAAWVLLFISGCAFGIGRCCISRRPREPKASKASAYAPNSNGNATLPPDPNASYAEQMRMDAIKAEVDRKARQKAGTTHEVGLPAFEEYETRPLTADDDASAHSPYRDQPSPANGNRYGAAGAATGYVHSSQLHPPARRQASAASTATHNNGARSPPPQGYGNSQGHSARRRPTDPSATYPSNTTYPPQQNASTAAYTPARDSSLAERDIYANAGLSTPAPTTAAAVGVGAAAAASRNDYLRPDAGQHGRGDSYGHHSQASSYHSAYSHQQYGSHYQEPTAATQYNYGASNQPYDQSNAYGQTQYNQNSRSPPLPGGYPGGHSQYPSQQSTYPPQQSAYPSQNYPQQQSYTRQASQNAYDPYSDQYNYPAPSTTDQYNYPAPSTTPGAYPPQQSYTPQPQAPYSPQHQSSYPIPSQPLVGGNNIQQDLNFPGVVAPAHQPQPTAYASSPEPINTHLPYSSPAAGPPASGWPPSPARGPRSPNSPTRLAAWQEEAEPSTVGPSTGRQNLPEDAPPDYETSTVGSRNAGYQNEKQTYRP